MDLTGIDRWWERRATVAPLVRLMRFVDRDPESGCWNWTGRRNAAGYGQLRGERGTSSRVAHRVAYELLVGPVDEALHLDHLCRNHACVNPGHLDPVTPQINTDRGLSAKRVVCDRAGHPMTGDNTGNRKDGRRYCKRCKRDRARALRAARGAKPHRNRAA